MRTGTWISDQIGSLPINSSAKIILAEIDNLHKSRGCQAGNSHFAKILGVSTETVSRIISKLRKLGYVNQTRFDGRSRTLEPTFQIASASQSTSRKPDATLKSIQPDQKHQSRVDSLNKAAYAIQPNPLYNKKQYKEKYKKEINSNSRNIDSKTINQNYIPDSGRMIHQDENFSNFLQWSRDKFSGSTREILQGLNSLESLLLCENRTIQLAWERWV
jgi:DNA-binding MarR family transcriptional regulator